MTKYQLQQLKVCTECRHHVSAHQYDQNKPRSGPQKCTVPDCGCKEFARKGGSHEEHS
jgi:hypothetical protein